MKLVKSVVIGILLTGSVGWAQTTGTVTINGRVDKTASIRCFSTAAIGAAAVANTTLPLVNVLDTVIDLGNIAPTAANNGLPQGAIVRLIARSNANYVLSAGVVAVGMGAAAGDLKLADFGFGLGPIAASGNGNLAAPVAGSTIAGAFGNNGLSGPVDANGSPFI